MLCSELEGSPSEDTSLRQTGLQLTLAPVMPLSLTRLDLLDREAAIPSPARPTRRDPPLPSDAWEGESVLLRQGLVQLPHRLLAT